MDAEAYFDRFAERDWDTRPDADALRIAVIGVGQFAVERALPAMAEGSYCEATTLVTGSPNRAETVASQFDVDTVVDYDAYHDGVAREDYDAVYVATPNALHLDYAGTAASFGKHVLVEKPLESTADRARRLVEACDDAGVTVMTAYRLQAEPAIRRMRELVRDGFVGEPVQVHGAFSSRLLDYADRGSWRLDPELSGGGALIDVGIYPLNTTRFLLDADPIAVQAVTSSNDEAFSAVDEHVAFQLTFPGGSTASFTASFNLHPKSRLDLTGSKGHVHVDTPFGGTVTQEILAERGDVRVEYTGAPVDEVVEEIDYFAHCVLTGIPPEPDGQDGVTDLEVVEAAYESARTGRKIDC